MDDLDICVKLEMTKIGAVPGQMGLATSSEHTSSNITHYLLSIGAPSYFSGVLFRGVAIAAAMRSHQSGSGER